MNALRKSINVPLVAIAAAAILVLVYQAGAMRSSERATPATVAVVDLEQVLNAIEERAALDVELEQRGARLDAEQRRRADEIDQMRRDLEDVFRPGSPEYQKAEDEYQQAALGYRVWLEFEAQKIDRDKGLIFRRLYNDVKKTIAEIARNRYDLVLLNDSVRDLQRGGEQAIGQQISARRILYANTSLDITEEVIQRMNNQFQVRGGGR